MKRFVNLLLYAVFFFAIYGAGSLAYNQFINKNICPEIIGIPACYIILICLVIPLIVHTFKKLNSIYFLCTGVAFSIALYGTVGQVLNRVQCPKTAAEIPMCYISLIIFTLLIVLKLTLIKKEVTNEKS